MNFCLSNVEVGRRPGLLKREVTSGQFLHGTLLYFPTAKLKPRARAGRE